MPEHEKTISTVATIVVGVAGASVTISAVVLAWLLDAVLNEMRHNEAEINLNQDAINALSSEVIVLDSRFDTHEQIIHGNNQYPLN